MKCAIETTPEKPVTNLFEISKEMGLDSKVATLEYISIAVLCLVFVEIKF